MKERSESEEVFVGCVHTVWGQIEDLFTEAVQGGTFGPLLLLDVLYRC